MRKRSWGQRIIPSLPRDFEIHRTPRRQRPHVGPLPIGARLCCSRVSQRACASARLCVPRCLRECGGPRGGRPARIFLLTVRVAARKRSLHLARASLDRNTSTAEGDSIRHGSRYRCISRIRFVQLPAASLSPTAPHHHLCCHHHPHARPPIHHQPCLVRPSQTSPCSATSYALRRIR